MKKNEKVQVEKEHYFEHYDDFNRWISYWWQIKLITSLNKRSILEIGVGNKTVSDYLKKVGYKVTTCDIDSSLEPDQIGDVTKLPYKKNSFEAILCCEVFEHLPFEKVKKALREIRRVTKEYAVISVFSANIGASFVLKLPLVRLIYRNVFLPMYWRKHVYNGEHYWELGKRKYPLARFKKVIESEGFKIVDDQHPPLNIYHHFFILKKK
jgi:ubiquinone/menaquinone biosynthesis C-methylase UbiE